jgi:hypothetical protein
MPNVTVKRYEDTSHGYSGTVEAEDGSWILFVPNTGSPQVWERTPSGDYAPSK